MKVDCLHAVHQNYRDLYRFVYRMTGNRETAEDIVQETFLRLSREDNHLPTEDAVRRWLFVVARNLCISLFRQGSRILDTEFDEEYGLSSRERNPSEEALENEQNLLVRQAVLSLPPSLREVVILREYEKKSYLDIATLVGCPMGTVRSRLAKARDFLKEKLQPLMEIQE